MPTLMLSPAFIAEYRPRLLAIGAKHGVPLELVAVSTRSSERLPEVVAARIDCALLTRDIRFGSLLDASDYRPVPEACPQFFDPIDASPDFRWLQISAAGVDRPVYGELMARGVRVTTGAGTHAEPIATTVIGAMLMLARGFLTWGEAQRARRWEALRAERTPRDVRGQTLVIVGAGSIGGHTARIAKSLGLEVIGVRRTPQSAGEVYDSVVHPSRLDELLGRCDWLMLCCPLNDETRGLIDARRLALLPRGARFVNVSRGAVVVERDLIEALRSGHLGGAYLDVFETEPLPADSPLWDLPNVICTPHNSSASDGNERRVAEIFLDNLDRWLGGRPLVNEVRSQP